MRSDLTLVARDALVAWQRLEDFRRMREVVWWVIWHERQQVPPERRPKRSLTPSS